MKKLLLLAVTAISLLASNPKAIIHTNQGEITLELYPKIAPLAVKNFVTKSSCL